MLETMDKHPIAKFKISKLFNIPKSTLFTILKLEYYN